jgi:hypothetical protein
MRDMADAVDMAPELKPKFTALGLDGGISVELVTGSGLSTTE